MHKVVNMTLGANWSRRRLAIALVAIALVVGAVTGASRMFVQRAKSRNLARHQGRFRRASCRPMRNGRASPSSPRTSRCFAPSTSPKARSPSTRIVRRRSSRPMPGRVVEAPGQAERHRRARAAAVRHRSHRHRAGAERFHHGAERAEQRALETQAGADQREASERSLCRQGGAAQGLAERAERSRHRAERPALRPRPRWRRRTTACASSAARKNRSPRFSRPGRSAPRRRSIRRSPAPSCSARSGRASSSRTGASDPVLRHRRSLDGVADRLRARERSGGCARRPGNRFHGAGAAGPEFQGEDRLRGGRRSIRPPAG